MVEDILLEVEDLKGPYFLGVLLRGSAIEKIAGQKVKKYHEETIHSALREEYSNKGWSFEKKQKRSIVMHKDKKISELLEDDTWVLFKKMGFIELNKDNHFLIKTGSTTKQIDVFAKDEHNVFIIFCTSQETNGPPSDPLKPKIREISDLKRDICQSIYSHYGKKMRVSFLIITKNIEWDETSEQLAKEKNIFFWKEEDLEAYHHLIEQLGASAKYQMYALLFGNQKAHEVSDIKVPAMRGGKGKNKYYCFLINPKKLFPVAYVHRREKSRICEVKDSYQRMISKKRLENIAKYIDKGNFFCNNIILNFRKKPIFRPLPKKNQIGNIQYGFLQFPPYYGCAWIIDGQHRLYGYSKCEKESKTEDCIPVIAFESLKAKDQANLFVDINKEQQKVNKNLLWELYPDIYVDSDEKEHKIYRAVSLIAQTLNSDEKSIFHKKISIPSLNITKDEKTNLTLTNVCDAIKENKLIDEDELLLYFKDYETSVNFAVDRINAYFETISSFLPGDWERGNKGLLRTNVGLRIFFIIFRQLLLWLKSGGEKKVFYKKDLIEFRKRIDDILTPIKSEFIEMPEDRRNQIRKASTKGQVVENTQRLLWDLKEDIGLGRELWYEGKGWAPGRPATITDNIIRSTLEETEKKLREFIVKELKKHYSNNWWKQGVPEGVKIGIKEEIQKNIEKERCREAELQNLSPERKISGFSQTPHIRLIIEYTPNWAFFEPFFIKDKNYSLSMFKSFENVRHKYQHFAEEECTETMKNLGYWSMKWIREFIGLDPPKITALT